MSKHTPEQIENWREYERVRLEGCYNMFSPNARNSIGLSEEEYLYCMKNYSSLKEHAKAKEA